MCKEASSHSIAGSKIACFIISKIFKFQLRTLSLGLLLLGIAFTAPTPANAQETAPIAITPAGSTTPALLECLNPLRRQAKISLVLRSKSGRRLASKTLTLKSSTRSRISKHTLLVNTGGTSIGTVRLLAVKRDTVARDSIRCTLTLSELSPTAMTRFRRTLKPGKATINDLTRTQQQILSRLSSIRQSVRLTDLRHTPALEHADSQCAAADLTRDQQINAADLRQLLAQLNFRSTTADIDGDGSTTLRDLSSLTVCWGTLAARPDGSSSSSSSAPPPPPPTSSSSSNTCSPGVDCPAELLSLQVPDIGTLRAGETLPPISVHALDRFGQVASQANFVVLLTSPEAAEGALTGTTSIALQSGVATFSSLSLLRPGLYTLQVSSDTLPTATTPPITVVAGRPQALRLVSTLPPEVNVWTRLPNIRLEIVDELGNLANQDTVEIIATLSDSSGTLLGTTRITSGNGRFDFSDLRYDTVGDFRIHFSSTESSSTAGGLTLTTNMITALGRKTYVNSWEDNNTDGLNRFINLPHVWNGADIYASPAQTILRAQQFAAVTAEFPTKHKNLLLREGMIRDRGLWDHPLDRLTDSSGSVVGYTAPDGTFSPYSALYWDHAAQQIRAELNSFFTAYHAAGGELDHLVVHLEEGFSNWALFVRANEEYGGADPANDIAYLQAIENDPKLNNPLFGLNGSSIRDLLSFHQVYPNIYDFYNSLYRNHYLEFNALMAARWNQYMRTMITEVVRPLYPNVKLSNYGAIKSSVQFGIPDGDGHRGYLFSETFPHQTFFDTQGGGLYGCLRQITNTGRGPDGASTYPKTVFNAFRYAVNGARSMRLSAPEMHLAPWVASRNWTATDCLIGNTDYYQELLLHLTMHGIDELTLWNPYASMQANQVVNQAMIEADTVLGHSVNRQPLDSSLASWTSSFVTSCIRSDKGDFCRITPNMSQLSTLSQAIVSEQPLILQVGSEQLALPGAALVSVDNPVSGYGFWVRLL